MNRIAGIAGGLLLALGLVVPIALAANSALPHTGRVLVSVNGDVALPAGEHADVVVVVRGTATINGEANVVVVVDGAANLVGATVDTVVGIRSPITLGPGTVVLGDVRTVDSTVTSDPTATVNGSIRDATGDLAGFGFALATGFLLLFVGFFIAVIAAALLVAALAARQVRAAETLISREPVKTFLVGVGGLVLIPIVAVLAIVTVIGAPLGLAILIGLWPLAGFVGYVVTAIWIGDWLLQRSVGDPAKRPYGAAILGLVILAVLGCHPGPRVPDWHRQSVRLRCRAPAVLADSAWPDRRWGANPNRPDTAGRDAGDPALIPPHATSVPHPTESAPMLEDRRRPGRSNRSAWSPCD